MIPLAYGQDLDILAGLEHSGSVVECLTQDRGAMGSSLTGVTVLCVLEQDTFTLA